MPTDHPREYFSGQWRSEDIDLLNVVIPRELAYAAVRRMASLGCVQLVDSCLGVPAHQRPYSGVLRVAEEVERRHRFFAERMRLAGIEPLPLGRAGVEPTVSSPNLQREFSPVTTAGSLSAMEDTSAREEMELREIATAVAELEIQLDRFENEIAACDALRDTLRTFASGGTQRVLVGIVEERSAGHLMRLMYRASRGVVWMKTAKITTQGLDKTAFALFTSSAVLFEKLTRIASSVGTQLLNINAVNTATSSNNNSGMVGGVEHGVDAYRARLTAGMGQLKDTLGQTYQRERETLQRLSRSFSANLLSCQEEKIVYSSLNLFHHSETFVKGQLWAPVQDRPHLEAALHSLVASSEHLTCVLEQSERMMEKKPTFFRTTKITDVFQMIVNSYGVPRYKEVNPAVFTIVTFPYLFGIMFGDIGHGAILTAVGAVLCLAEGRLSTLARTNEMFGMIFSGRYLLFAMGLFATYIGLLYNDFFGFSIGLFESSYQWPELPPSGPGGEVRPNYPTGHPSIRPDSVYPIGIDVAWAETENKLEFYNSLKMKAAVVVGVVQMLLGLVLSLFNHLRECDFMGVFFVVVPEIIFLSCTFGYMTLLIIIKWCTAWENTHDAPSLLETMTNFFLAPGNVTMPLFSGQAGLQVFLLLMAFAQVPVMLLVVPFHKLWVHKKEAARAAGMVQTHRESDILERGMGDEFSDDDTPLIAGGDFAPKFDFGEVMIHYVIHTIEFVLGCVSNTASYLRLWALSLAHAQLSEVFFSFALCVTIGLDSGSGVVVVLGTAVWLAASLMVLLMMESLSAFLHSLRLHWVEFQTKFFAADGVAFEPLTLPTHL